MITCPACSKQNQDHYRFCLGCGAELPRGGPPAAKSGGGAVDEETNIGGTVSEPSVGSAPPAPYVAPAAEPEPAAAAELFAEPAAEPAAAPEAEPPLMPPGKCPECEYVNPPTNRFCASCGFRLDEVKAVAKPAVPVVGTDGSGAILVALDPEGNEIGRHELAVGESTIGRDNGGIFGNDAYLSPQHAIFHAENGAVRVTDAGSLNGLFRKLIAEQRSGLTSGQRFRIGQELLQYDGLTPKGVDADGVSAMGSAIEEYVGTVSLVVGRKTTRPSHPIASRGLNLGRERGDVLFPDDGYVSGLHCHLSFEDGRAYVTDLGSSNGTFVQLLGETELNNGDVLLMGQQLYRVNL